MQISDTASPTELLTWAVDRFGDRFALTTAFGISGVCLMHLASRVVPGVRVYFIDTGFHFPETLAMVDRVRARMPVDLQVVEPLVTLREQRARHGEGLYARDPDACCALRKVAPQAQVLRRLDAWATGLRRDQGPTRAGTPLVEVKTVEGRTLHKLNPLAAWTSKDVWRHIFEHDLPYNPLHDQGYPSVGCAPCTRAVEPGEDERAGRWAGRGKTECGLHVAF